MLGVFKPAIFGLCVMALPAAAQQTTQPEFAFHHWGGAWHGGLMGPFMMLVVLVVLVVVAVLAVRWLAGMGATAARPLDQTVRPTAQDILDERFARGEIDKDEFEERRRILRG